MECSSCGREWPQEFRVCPLCAVSLRAELGEGASGAIAQGQAQAAGERGVVAERIGGSVFTGDTIVLAREVAGTFWEQFAQADLSDEALHQATSQHLQHILDRYRYLDFKGMGVSDRVPLRVPLVDMYVPLKAHIELPEGETWARDALAPLSRQCLYLAGRQVSEEEVEVIGRRLSEPVPVLDLLCENDGLIVLGDPGAGKTTFLKYLALRLAMGQGAALRLGARLPVLVPLSAYANALVKGDIPLTRFIAEHYRDRGVDLPIGSMLRAALEQGGALLLLDGLDEVSDPGRRRIVVDRVVDCFVTHRPKGNKFVLTSRIVGYRQIRPLVEGLRECTLVDFEDREIGAFVDRWTAAIERAARGDTLYAAREAAHEREELLLAIHRNPSVRRLAASPLLLTILALMKRQGIALPERRVELYQKHVEALLKHWNLARGLDRPPAWDLDIVETTRVLAPLALWMHETSPGVGLVKRGAMLRKLRAIYEYRGVDDPEAAARQLLADVHDYAGLLLERGPGEYGFIHLTFQEYLAAVGIARLGQRDIRPIVDVLTKHVENTFWYEIARLTIGYLGIVQQWEEVASDVVEALIERQPGVPGQTAVMVGEAVADAWPGGVTPHCKGRVVQVLCHTMGDDTDVVPALRVAAGNALARLGDPRPGIVPSATQHAAALQEMAFCYVPAGPFWMGEGVDQHLNECLDTDYWIARYPTTAGQFETFAREAGHPLREAWRQYGRLRNHPTVVVTWHEAVAFCRWLTEVWQERGILRQDWTLRLPSEAEWEKAARGGLEVPSSPLVAPARDRPWLQQMASTALTHNDDPRRRYPWGATVDANLANYRDTELGSMSAVGCFPGGASPYGVEDQSGNVWEWTRSLWGRNVSVSAFKYPYDPTDGREDPNAGDGVFRVMCGGAFSAPAGDVCCASRNRDLPNYGYGNLGFRVVVTQCTR